MGHAVIIHLIRHEKTKANEEKKYIGWTDESIMVKKPLQIPIQATKVYGSDLKRCVETAKLYFPKANYHAYSELRELNFGDFEMKTYEQLKDNSVYRKWIDFPESITPPNGESFISFKNRIIDAFYRIVSTSGEYVFVVHGGVIRLLLSQFSPSNDSFQQIVVKHQEVITLTWTQLADLRGGLRCESLSVEPIMENENM